MVLPTRFFLDYCYYKWQMLTGLKSVALGINVTGLEHLE